ncbi:rhomboid family intramembrane serine protease [Rhodobacterales bacterium HKCCE3408]|nr:rhomboid family intramembrane serine protease [Rhodobacterales bacterium HKCCE3408]
MDDPNASPFNALPTVVVVLAVVIGGLELMFQLATAGLLGGPGGVGWRLAAIRDYGVSGELVRWMVDNAMWQGDILVRFVSYPLIQGGLVPALFAIVFILALGKLVATAFSQWSVPVIFWIASIAGALGFSFLTNSAFVLVGGMPGAYGLIGAFTYILWTRPGQGAAGLRAFQFIAILAAVQLGFGLFAGEFGPFVSEICGFAAGFLVSFLVRPGGWTRMLSRMRQR